MCKYAGYNTLADVWFAIFLGSWIITRHIFFPMTIYFLTFQLDGLVDYHWSPEQGYFLNATLHTVFIALLVCLECILCAWLLMILKVVRSLSQIRRRILTFLLRRFKKSCEVKVQTMCAVTANCKPIY